MTTEERIKNWKIHDSQRGFFGFSLYKAMAENPNIWLVTGDLGYALFDKIREDFPGRFLNVGAAEQAGVGICVGLALKGKIPFFYTISSFLLRAAEPISLYLSHEQIAVHLVGSGRDDDYKHDGFSHDATQAQKFIHDLAITEYYPQDKESIPHMVDAMIKNEKPSFISLKR